jgi:hypothetical protein
MAVPPVDAWRHYSVADAEHTTVLTAPSLRILSSCDNELAEVFTST